LFKKDFKKVFGIDSGKIRRSDSQWVTSSSAKEVLNYLERFNFYTKKWSVPEEIFNALNKEKIEYIKAFFDDDGTITKHHKAWKIRLYSLNKKGLIGIKKLLNQLKITSIIHGPYGFRKKYELDIEQKNNVIKFCGLIGFNHPKKLKHARKVLLEDMVK